MNDRTPSLPQIGSYEVPQEKDLPQGRLDWTLSADRCALLVHDMQDYFLRPYAKDQEPLPSVLKSSARLIEICRLHAIPIFYTAQDVKQERCDRGLQADLWGPGMQDPEMHQKIVTDLTPVVGDYVLNKHRYSAFQRSNLETMMTCRGRDQLLICGVYAHIGCLLSAADAFMRDIQPFFVVNAMADFSREKHDMAMAYVNNVCGVTCTLRQVGEWL
jgi:bifunctional isochorismate lyase/aryl carrier protein